MSNTSAIASVPAQSSRRIGDWLGLVPGLLLLAAVGYGGK